MLSVSHVGFWVQWLECDISVLRLAFSTHGQFSALLPLLLGYVRILYLEGQGDLVRIIGAIHRYRV